MSLSIAVVALAGALAPAAPEVPAKGAPEPLAVNIPLAKEQLKLIDQITTDYDLLYKRGEMNITDPAFNLWARRRLETLRATEAGKSDMIAATERYLQRVKLYEQAIKGQYDRSEVPRSAVYAAHYERLEAEMLLNQEKAR